MQIPNCRSKASSLFGAGRREVLIIIEAKNTKGMVVLLALASLARPDYTHCRDYGRDCKFWALCDSPPEQRVELIKLDYHTEAQAYLD